MLPNVNIIINRQGLGQIAFTNDGIMGLVVSGVSVAGRVRVGEPFVINSLADAENAGITEQDNPVAYKQVKEFYEEAGSGAKLWLVLTDNALMSKCATGTSNELRSLINDSKGEIALVGICRGTMPSAIVVDGLNEDVLPTITAVQTLAEEYQRLMMPFSAVIDGIGFSGNASSALDLKTMTKNRCSVILAASEDDGVASVGQFIGRLAKIPVQRKASRVKDGALANIKAYLTDGAEIGDREATLNDLHDKGYIVYRSFAGRSGYFYSGDPTCTAASDDLNIIARNRIIDKVMKIAYNVYVEEIDDDVEMTEQGTLEPAVVGYLKSKIEQQVNGNMTDEISNFNAVIDPKQNILSGEPLNIVLQITPKGYLNPINVLIGFVNPLLNNN